MTDDPVRAIARAVLYEGYLLWPYRRSAAKNHQRFTFGGVHPESFARIGGDAGAIVMECLLEHDPGAGVEVALRFLHLLDRRPARREDDRLRPVDELVVDGERHLAFEEAAEREAGLGPASLEELAAGRALPVEIAGGVEVEALGDEAAIIRSWQPLEGALEISAAPLRPGLARLSVRFANRSRWPGAERRAALARTFLSTHVMARVTRGAFVSQTDPPEELRQEAAGCRNEGVWPVLVGEQGERHTLLGSPIILPDHPRVAPESPGDLFDGGEIDALLIHSVRSLSDAEREEMAATDPRAREILERCLSLPPERMRDLYGAVRELRAPDG